MKSLKFGLGLKLQSKKDLTYLFISPTLVRMEKRYYHESILILFGLKGLFFSKSVVNSMEKILVFVLPSESKAAKVSVDWQTLTHTGIKLNPQTQKIKPVYECNK